MLFLQLLQHSLFFRFSQMLHMTGSKYVLNSSILLSDRLTTAPSKLVTIPAYIYHYLIVILRRSKLFAQKPPHMVFTDTKEDH